VLGRASSDWWLVRAVVEAWLRSGVGRSGQVWSASAALALGKSSPLCSSRTAILPCPDTKVTRPHHRQHCTARPRADSSLTATAPRRPSRARCRPACPNTPPRFLASSLPRQTAGTSTPLPPCYRPPHHPAVSRSPASRGTLSSIPPQAPRTATCAAPLASIAGSPSPRPLLSVTPT
jgi:hypothetical protein